MMRCMRFSMSLRSSGVKGWLDLEVVVEAVLDDGADAELGVQGRTSCTAWAMTWVAEWRMIARPSSSRVEGDGVDGVAVVQRRVQRSRGLAVRSCTAMMFLSSAKSWTPVVVCRHLLRFAVDV